jgi:hypothetical protein
VVGTLLPLLFGLFGGASGFYFSKLDLSSQSGAKSFRMTSIGLVLMCGGCIAGSVLGASLRIGVLSVTNPASSIVQKSAGKAPLTPADLLSLQLLVGRLHLLGVDAQSTEAIVTGAVTDLQTHEVPVEKLVNIAQLRKAIVDVTTILTQAAKEDKAPDDLQQARYELIVSTTLLDALQQQSTAATDFRGRVVRQVSGRITSAINALNSPRLNSWRATHASDYDSFATLDSSAYLLSATLENSPWQDRVDPAKDLSEFVRALIGAVPTSSKSFFLANNQAGPFGSSPIP